MLATADSFEKGGSPDMTTVSSPSISARQGLLVRHPLISYFIITFVFSWLLLLPGPLTYYGILSVSPRLLGYFGIASLLGPALAGFIMSAATVGAAGVGDLLRRMVLWRVGIRWYLFAILGIPSVMVLATLVLHPGALGSLDLSAQPFALPYLIAFVSMALIGGPLFEEPGRTGFAQPRLQWLYGPLLGSLILGGLWALWHLPGFLIPSQNFTDIPPRGTVLDFVVFSLALVGLRLVIVWVVNNTRGSVLMAILTHASWNTFYSAALIGLFPVRSVLGSYLNLTIAACALVLIAVTRGRLGYRAEAPEAPRVR
jgi:membrane protease YdiL (CAAX protease family)